MEHSFCFEAGHFVHGTSGACCFPHGHSFVLILKRSGQDLQADCDSFVAIVQQMIETTFHHKWLNDTLNTNQPDLDYIADWIKNYLKAKVSTLSEVILYNSLDHFIKK